MDIREIKKYIDNMENKEMSTANKIKKDVCTNCGSNSTIEDHNQGIYVCTQCGEVLSGMIDYNAEWKFFDEHDKNNGRCGNIINVLLPRSSLGTHLAGSGRLKMVHGWNIMPYKERSLNNDFKKMHEICIKGSILKCIEDDAKILYKMASECKHNIGKNKDKYIITRGINRISINAACILYACSRANMARTPSEIALLYNIKESELNKGCKSLLKLLNIRGMILNMGTTKPEHFVKRYCDILKIKNNYTLDAIKISKNIDKLNIASDHTPYSLAATSILIMVELNNISINKKNLAEVFNISEVTISKTYKEIEKYKNILSNDEIINKIVEKINLQNNNISIEILERMNKFNINNTDDNTLKYIIN